MEVLLSRFYTTTGDDGLTGLLGEGRVPKHDPRLEAVGAVDEANAALGLARAHAVRPHTRETLLQAQRDLYHLMAELAATPENAARFRRIDAARVTWLESQADALSEQVSLPREFIVPGDVPAAAFLDLARTVVRRAERRVAALLHAGALDNRDLLRYLNRLSSLLYVLELAEHQAVRPQRPTTAREV